MANTFLTVPSFTDLHLSDFLRKLASADATPGGGSAAALAGAIAGALVTMVAGISQVKATEEGAEAMELLMEQGEQLVETLSADIDRDAAAYDAVMQAMRLPRETEEQKTTRTAVILSALKGAADVPLEVAEESLAAAEMALLALEKGAPHTASDAGVAMALALAGAEGAVLNVAINLDGLKDPAVVDPLQQELVRIETRIAELRGQARSLLEARIHALPRSGRPVTDDPGRR